MRPSFKFGYSVGIYILCFYISLIECVFNYPFSFSLIIYLFVFTSDWFSISCLILCLLVYITEYLFALSPLCLNADLRSICYLTVCVFACLYAYPSVCLIALKDSCNVVICSSNLAIHISIILLEQIYILWLYIYLIECLSIYFVVQLYICFYVWLFFCLQSNSISMTVSLQSTIDTPFICLFFCIVEMRMRISRGDPYNLVTNQYLMKKN